MLVQRTAAGTIRYFAHRDTRHYGRLVEEQLAYQRSFAAALDGDEAGPFDVIVCPAHALAAIPHGASKDIVIGGGYIVSSHRSPYPPRGRPGPSRRTGAGAARTPPPHARGRGGPRSEHG